MAPVIYLIRHAEAEHNVSKDFSHRDPPLTRLGNEQASALTRNFPHPETVAIVLSSPLKRALQTTLAGFSHIIAPDGIGNRHNDSSATVIIDPDLQERSDLPCDTGSDRGTLEQAFPHLDFSKFDDEWFAKSGLYAADEASVILRAKVCREKLWNIAVSLEQTPETREMAVIVVTHGVFMKYLSQDMGIDLPKAGWKAFNVRKEAEGQVVLFPVCRN